MVMKLMTMAPVPTMTMTIKATEAVVVVEIGRSGGVRNVNGVNVVPIFV